MVNDILLLNANQESASGTRSPETRGPGHGNLGPEPGLIIKSRKATRTQIQNLRDSELSRELKNSRTRARGLKIFRDTVPVPYRPLHCQWHIGVSKYRKICFRKIWYLKNLMIQLSEKSL